MDESLTEPAKHLLLVALLTNDRIISSNGKAFLKELILRRDPRVASLLHKFESKEAGDATFLQQIHQLIEDESFALYNDLFFDTSLEVGKALSKSERDTQDLNENKSLIYGEVDYSSFYKVLRKINPAPGSTFYDLGSGTGKAVMAARFAQDFGRCVGIEILETLHGQASKIADRFNKKFRRYLSMSMSQHVSVHHGSILEVDWSDGDVVFANSTCFDDSLIDDLSKLSEALKPGAIVITFTKGLTSNKFEVLERKRYRMSWGPATVYIHRRLNHNGTPVGPPNLCILPEDSIMYGDDVPQSLSSLSEGNDSRRQWDAYAAYQGASGSEEEEEVGDEEDSEEQSDDNTEDEDESNEGDYGDYSDYSPTAKQAASLSPPQSVHITVPGPAHSSVPFMNSPQDSALLRRKRAAQIAHPI
jgi:SAM-dependent methyltransferase